MNDAIDLLYAAWSEKRGTHWSFNELQAFRAGFDKGHADGWAAAHDTARAIADVAVASSEAARSQETT